MPRIRAALRVRRATLDVSIALATALSGCSSPTEAPLVPTPEAVLWKQPLTLGFPQGEIGDGILFQTALRVVNGRGARASGATVTMLDGSTGSIRWQVSSDSITGAIVPLAGGMRDVYVQKGSSNAYALSVSVLDAATGQVRWQSPSCDLSPARAGGAIIVLEATPTVTSRSVFVGRDADTGGERWRIDLTNENVNCYRSRLLAIRGDTAVYLVNTGALTPPFTPRLSFLRVTASGAYRFVDGPASLTGDYVASAYQASGRMLGDRPVVLLRDSTRFHGVDIWDGTLLWSRDPQPADVRKRAYDPQGYRVVSSSRDVITVASTDSSGYPIWRATLDSRSGAILSEARTPRDDVTPLSACGDARVLAFDNARRLLLLDGATQTIARRLSVTLGAAGESFVRPTGVDARTSTYAGRYGFVVDFTLPYETNQWLAFRCD